MFVEPLLIYLLTGALCGLISGVLGIGGGIVVVPALLYSFHLLDLMPPALTMHVAAGSSLAVMMFTSHASIRVHYKRAAIQWLVFLRLMPGMILGTLIGAIAARFLSTQVLKGLFGLFLLFIAFKMSQHVYKSSGQSVVSLWVHRLVSLLIGVNSGLLGIGGGTLVIPYLNYCGMDMRQAAAISSLCTLIVAIIGTFAFMVVGFHEPGLPAYSTGYVYWPCVFAMALTSSVTAPIGAHWVYRLSARQLKYAFIGITSLTALNLLASVDISTILAKMG